MNAVAKTYVARFLTFTLLLSFPSAARSAPQNQTQAIALEAGKSIERTMAGDETHAYTVILAPGTYGQIEVEQTGINLIVNVFSEGKLIRRADLGGFHTPELLSFVSGATPATYRIELNVSGDTSRPGPYTIKLNERRVATAEDKARVEAEELSETGMMTLLKQTREARLEALDKFQKSLIAWRAAQVQWGEARAFYHASYTLNLLGQYLKVGETAQQGIPLAQSIGNRSVEAYLLDELGSSYNNRGERKKALDIFLQALQLRSEDDPVGRGYTLSNIAIAYGWIGERTKALGYMDQVAAIMRDTGERLKQSTTLGNMCVINTDLGRYEKAFELCNQALAIKRELDDPAGHAVVFNSLGNIYSNKGDYQKALDLYQQSRALYQSLKEIEGEGVEVNNIGWVYAQLGEYEKAIELYRQVLPAFRERGNKYGIATLLNNLGVAYAKLKDYRKALEVHLEVLPMRPEKDDRSGRALTLNNIASCYAELGEKTKALQYYEEALAMHRSAEKERQHGITLKDVGVFYRKQGNASKAFEYLNEARRVSKNAGDLSSEANVLSELARLEVERGNLLESHRLIEQAIDVTESVRNNLKSQQLRTSFLASVRQYYEFEIGVLMRLHQQRPTEGFAAAALQVSERSRARSLLELLREARAEIREGVDRSLLERESVLRRAIAEKAEQQTRYGNRYSEEQASALSKEIEALAAEYDQVQSRIRQTSPRYASLIEPVPLGMEAIQRQVLDDDTLLLEYALGEQKSFVWVVTHDAVRSFELPGRAAIEQEAKRFYQLLTERGVSVASETLTQRKERLDRVASEYQTAAASLSRTLLPFAAELKQKRLLVVAEGVLQYVPFAALPVPGAERPLIVDHEIVKLPSASVLAVLREERATRRPASRSVAVLADPVFSASDSRLAFGHKPAGSVDTSAAVDVQRSVSELGLGDLARLRFSRQEADEITRLSNDKRDLKALDFSANRSLAAASLNDYRIVHFATHGLINNQHPDLSGIVLSLVDERGRSQNGFLRLYDIYNLKLNADLVVLSACQTALGKEVRGEGLMGLTRGFMYAGAPRVVASLWRIDDRASAEMMRRFYSSMLKDGLRPAAALRAAQVSMLNDKRWQSPHFWAAFTVQGEWR